MKHVFLLLIFLPWTILAQSDVTALFKQNGVGGSCTVYDLQKNKWIYSNEADSRIATLPASTFKIINSLIALEEGVVKDEYELVPWVGIQQVDTVHYGYRPDIYRDMNLADALSNSAVWVHLELAKKIGREKYKRYLTLCGYGNLDFSEKGTDFWNFGSFAITPVEQINFVRKLYEDKLPFSKRTMAIVKKIMLTESGEGYSIRAKTGMGILADQTIGWWVGYVEKENNVYFFATRLRNPTTKFSVQFAQQRKELTKAFLKQQSILP